MVPVIRVGLSDSGSKGETCGLDVGVLRMKAATRRVITAIPIMIAVFMPPIYPLPRPSGKAIFPGMENIWADRPTDDLLGRLSYHQDKIKYWKAQEGHKDKAEMIRRWEESYFDLLQVLMRRGVAIENFQPDSEGPFRDGVKRGRWLP
jgi:hypothetical protein